MELVLGELLTYVIKYAALLALAIAGIYCGSLIRKNKDKKDKE